MMQMSHQTTKPTKWHVRHAKTQISLGIHTVWSESLLSAWRNLGSFATHWGHSKESDQTGQIPKLICVFAGHTCHFVGFVMCWLKLSYSNFTTVIVRSYSLPIFKGTGWSGPSSSKLTMLLVNVSFKLWSLNMAYMLLFLLKKCE